MPEIRGSDEVFVGSVRDTNADAHAPAAIKADDEILEDACDREAFVRRVILVMAVVAFGLSAGSARTSRAGEARVRRDRDQPFVGERPLQDSMPGRRPRSGRTDSG
jgi:hypothetical protein